MYSSVPLARMYIRLVRSYKGQHANAVSVSEFLCLQSCCFEDTPSPHFQAELLYGNPKPPRILVLGCGSYLLGSCEGAMLLLELVGLGCSFCAHARTARLAKLF